MGEIELSCKHIDKVIECVDDALRFLRSLEKVLAAELETVPHNVFYDVAMAKNYLNIISEPLEKVRKINSELRTANEKYSEFLSDLSSQIDNYE